MIEERQFSEDELHILLVAEGDHFLDTKSKEIQPSKLQETFVAFANADGGDIFLGIEDRKREGDRVRPFTAKEDANAILAVLLEQTTPAVENVLVEFLSTNQGYLLHISVPKSPKVHYTASGDCYVRLNAGKVKIKGERVTELAYSKGALLYERTPAEAADLDELTLSASLKSYMSRVQTSLEPARFLKKQRLLVEKDGGLVPTVGSVLLFDDEPQAAIDTRCAIKVYRLRTTETDYKRERPKCRRRSTALWRHKQCLQSRRLRS